MTTHLKSLATPLVLLHLVLGCDNAPTEPTPAPKTAAEKQQEVLDKKVVAKHKEIENLSINYLRGRIKYLEAAAQDGDEAARAAHPLPSDEEFERTRTRLSKEFFDLTGLQPGAWRQAEPFASGYVFMSSHIGLDNTRNQLVKREKEAFGEYEAARSERSAAADAKSLRQAMVHYKEYVKASKSFVPSARTAESKAARALKALTGLEPAEWKAKHPAEAATAERSSLEDLRAAAGGQ